MKQNNNINRRVIRESVEPNKVVDSIKKRYEVEIDYNSDDSKARGRRIIQPVAYGLSRAGNPVLRAFQPFGDTKTKVPHWKLFRLDRILKWKSYPRRKFDTPPGQYNAEGKYNINGDNGMTEVFCNADFINTKNRYEKGGLKKYNADVRKKKEEENPYYGLKKNIEKSVMATPEVMKRIQQTAQPNRFKNWQNAYEMSQVNNFGDNAETNIEGPVIKDNGNNSVSKQNTSHNINYQNVINNGPIRKQEISVDNSKSGENTEEENKEEEINNNENNG